MTDRARTWRRTMMFVVLVVGVAGPVGGEGAQDAQPCIDINTASLERLQGIIHIGEERAAQIIALRRQRRFESVRELSRVSGIGPARLLDIFEEGRACVEPDDGLAGNAP